jgi:hypothetical protein
LVLKPKYFGSILGNSGVCTQVYSSIFKKKSTPGVFTPEHSFNSPKSLKINCCVIGPFLTEKET